jgi:2,4-dienoyl-CoA reductase-like NADH-dependent reductase (Old Yellow Enzyme family)
MPINSLFEPITLGNLHLPNRIVMAPMTRSFSPNGIPTEEVAQYYKRRAANGVGLVVSEGTAIGRPAAKNDPNVPDFHGADALAGWKRVIDEVHAAQGKMAPQLWHVGISRDPRHPEYRPQPVDSPSGITGTGKKAVEPMTEEAIADTIAAYGKAARDALELGFDCVEIHGAHSYLIDQFFWEVTNRRTDQWGGRTLHERTHFAFQVVRAVRMAIGPEVPLIFRLSQWKVPQYDAKNAYSPDELLGWLQPLVDAGVDVFHCSQRRYWEPEFAGSDLNLAGWAKKLTGKPTITVGSVGLAGEFIGSFRGEGSQVVGLEELIRRLERGDFDLVAVGRALLADPEWAVKVRDGRKEELHGFDARALASLY